QSYDAAALRRAADHLTTGYQRQALLGQVRVLRLVGVGVVDPGPVDVDQYLAGARGRLGYVGEGQHLGTAELGDPDRAHGSALLEHGAADLRDAREAVRLGGPAGLDVPALAGPAAGQRREERIDNGRRVEERDVGGGEHRAQLVDDRGVGETGAQPVDPDAFPEKAPAERAYQRD